MKQSYIFEYLNENDFRNMHSYGNYVDVRHNNDEYKQANNTVKYSKVCENDMELSYAAADYLSTKEV